MNVLEEKLNFLKNINNYQEQNAELEEINMLYERLLEQRREKIVEERLKYWYYMIIYILDHLYPDWKEIFILDGMRPKRQ